MKTKSWLILIPVVMFSSCYVSRQPVVHNTPNPSYNQTPVSYNRPAPPQAPPAINFQTFYDELSPYGYWIYNDYGYVWIPNYGADFSPYRSNGHWVYTEYGWTWYSNYNWGWATFHYGRWIWDDYYGWAWCPGYDWAPAWVFWGQYNSYYGWAPMPPDDNHGHGNGHHHPPINHWWFVDQHGITNGNGNNNFVVINNITVNNITIINNTSVYNNQSVPVGPGRKEVETVTGNKVTMSKINDMSTAGAGAIDGNGIHLYRPTVNKPSSTFKPVPSRVEIIDNIKPVKDRTDKPVPQNKLNKPGKNVTPVEPKDTHINPVQSPSNSSPKEPVKPNNQGKEQVKPVTPGKEQIKPKPQEPAKPNNSVKEDSKPLPKEKGRGENKLKGKQNVPLQEKDKKENAPVKQKR